MSELKAVLYWTTLYVKVFLFFVFPIYTHEGDSISETPLYKMQSSTTLCRSLRSVCRVTLNEGLFEPKSVKCCVIFYS